MLGRLRQWSNCIIVALALWIRLRGRCWIAVKRSISFNGLIPHACVIVPGGGKRGESNVPHLLVIQYVPRTRKAVLFGRGDWFVLFDGKFEAARYERVSTMQPANFQQALDLALSLPPGEK